MFKVQVSIYIYDRFLVFGYRILIFFCLVKMHLIMQKSEIPVESGAHDRRCCMVHHNSVTSPLCHYTFSDTAHLIEIDYRHVLDQDRRPACLS